MSNWWRLVNRYGEEVGRVLDADTVAEARAHAEADGWVVLDWESGPTVDSPDILIVTADR